MKKELLNEKIETMSKEELRPIQEDFPFIGESSCSSTVNIVGAVVIAVLFF